MHPYLLTALHAAATTTTAAKKHSSSSSSVFIFVLLGAFIIIYFFFLRPRSQRARQQAQATKDFSLGDEVISIGGIVGKVVGFDGDDVEVEVDDGVVLTFLRRAVNPRNQPAPARPAAGGLFGRRPPPAPVDDDDDFDDDEEDQPAISSGSGSSGRNASPGKDHSPSGEGTSDADESADDADGPPNGR